jgi:hypothetical protein
MRRSAALFCMLVFATGCDLGGGDTEATIEESELKGAVLQPDDLPRVFIQFDEGRQVRADSPAGERSDPERFGRIEGWKARYRRPGSATTRGPLVIESRVDVFESADGAQDELEAIAESGFRRVEDPPLGDAARAFETAPGGTGAVRYYLVAWREDNATALLFVNGFERRLTLADVLALARRQQRRLAAAASV